MIEPQFTLHFKNKLETLPCDVVAPFLEHLFELKVGSITGFLLPNGTILSLDAQDRTLLKDKKAVLIVNESQDFFPFKGLVQTSSS